MTGVSHFTLDLWQQRLRGAYPNLLIEKEIELKGKGPEISGPRLALG